MSYVLFLIVFVCLPLVGLIHLMRGSLRRVHLLMLVGIATLAVVYSAPWDNYLAATRVRYYNPQLVLNAPVGFAPFEAYAFFAFQSLLTGVFVLWLWRRLYPVDFEEKSGAQPSAPKHKRRKGH